jgi:hypothetical protein
MWSTTLIMGWVQSLSDNLFGTVVPHGRRLQSSPSWVTFVVVVGLGLILWYLLRILQSISNNWKKMMKERIDMALKKRKAVSDPFRNSNGYSWDYVMVFEVRDAEKSSKATKAQLKFSLKHILDQLAEAGLQTKLFYSVQRDEVYVKIRAPLRRLQREADRINYRLQLEPTQLANALRIGNMKGPVEHQWKSVEVPNNNIETTIEPYDYIYFDYRMEASNELFMVHGASFFRGVDRLKLIANIIAARTSEGGANLDVYRLIRDNCMITVFPLHDAVELRDVEERWLRMCQWPWLQHVDEVRDYFGEKIALFFTFLGHYTTWLFGAGIIGFFAWIWVAGDNNNPNAPVIPYFAAFIGIWSTLFLEFWKRTEKYAAMRWGMIGAEETEQAR